MYEAQTIFLISERIFLIWALFGLVLLATAYRQGSVQLSTSNILTETKVDLDEAVAWLPDMSFAYCVGDSNDNYDFSYISSDKRQHPCSERKKEQGPS